MKELEKNELMGVDGGKVAYVTPVNPKLAEEYGKVAYAICFLENVCIAAYNGAAWIRNQLGD